MFRILLLVLLAALIQDRSFAQSVSESIWAPQFQAQALQESHCARLFSEKPKPCKPMTAGSRRRILALASPERFPKTRYRLPPRLDVPFSQETDCTRFVRGIYAQAGYPVPQIPTDGFICLSTLKEVPDAQALAGDLVIYPGHVGILEKSGRVVSATLGGRGRPATLPPEHPSFVSSIQSVPRHLLARGPSKILRWVCPQNY